MSAGTVPDANTGSPYGGGALPFSGVAGRSLPVDFQVAPVLPVEGPQSVPLQVAVVRVDGTLAGDTSGRKCPRDERDWRRPSGVSMMAGGAGSPSGGGGGGTLASPDVTESLLPVVSTGGPPLVGAVNPAGPDCPVVAGGPVGPCETPSPSFSGSIYPIEYSVLDYSGPDGRHDAVGPVGPFRMLSSSDCHPAGPAGPYVAGGPVGPDASFKVLEPLEHSVLDHADPAGQHAAVGTLSPCDCHPAGPYVAGGPVGPDDFFKVLEPLDHSVLDHADSMLMFRIHWNR